MKSEYKPSDKKKMIAVSVRPTQLTAIDTELKHVNISRSLLIELLFNQWLEGKIKLTLPDE